MDVSERRIRVARLRNSGRTFEEIVKAFANSGITVTKEMVSRDWKAYLREITDEDRERMVAQQRAILMDFRRTNYMDAVNTDPDRIEERLAAQKEIRAAMDHEAKLFGLYSPQKVQLGISDTEFAEETARLISSLGLEPPKELLKDSARNVIDAEIIEPGETAEAVERAATRVEGWSNI